MLRSYLARRFEQILGAIASGSGSSRAGGERVRFPVVETLDSRVLLSNIVFSGGNSNSGSSSTSSSTSTAVIASGVLSSTPSGGDYQLHDRGHELESEQ